jgi:hypothetical protein
VLYDHFHDQVYIQDRIEDQVIASEECSLSSQSKHELLEFQIDPDSCSKLIFKLHSEYIKAYEYEEDQSRPKHAGFLEYLIRGVFFAFGLSPKQQSEALKDCYSGVMSWVRSKEKEDQRELWCLRPDKSETPDLFIARVYGDLLQSGLSKSDLRRSDIQLYHAYYKWKKGPGKKIEFSLMTKKQRNDRLLTLLEQSQSLDDLEGKLSPSELVRLKHVAAKRSKRPVKDAAVSHERAEATGVAETPQRRRVPQKG